jgi:hypothetical protein
MFGIRTAWIHEISDGGGLGHQLVKQFQPFCLQCRAAQENHSRNVGSRPVEVGHEADLDWVGTCREHDRNRRSCRFGCERCGIATGHDHGDLTAN